MPSHAKPAPRPIFGFIEGEMARWYVEQHNTGLCGCAITRDCEYLIKAGQWFTHEAQRG